MTTYVSAKLHRLVASRASRLCEYFLMHEDDTFLGCQVDHVISEKHGGPTAADNLSYACAFCNRSKGADIGSIAASTGKFIRFFNPRTDRWLDHFVLAGVVIEPQTQIGEATVRILAFNEPSRILERQTLQDTGRYPPDTAKSFLDA